MPMYEYHCEPCGHDFETLVRSSSDVPRCPRCEGTTLVKQFSVPAAARMNAASPALAVASPRPAAGGCGAPWCGTGAGPCGMG